MKYRNGDHGCDWCGNPIQPRGTRTCSAECRFELAQDTDRRRNAARNKLHLSQRLRELQDNWPPEVAKRVTFP